MCVFALCSQSVPMAPQLANMGGRTGGWDPRDHDSFLRVLTILQTHPTYNNVDIFSNVIKSVGMDEELHLMGEATAAQSRAHPVSVNPQYVAKFVSFLPGKTVDEIEEHVIW